MAQMKIFGIVFAVFFVFLVGCKSDSSEAIGQESESAASKALNIVVILDTSDRISKEKHPGQVQRDLDIVAGIVDFFEGLVRHELLESEKIEYLHRLAFVVPEQPGVPQIPLEIMEKLTIEDSGNGRIFPKFKQQKSELLPAIKKLYEFVQGHGQFTGSDIWDWFRSKAEFYLQGDYNYIICISDGYLNFNYAIEKQRRKGTYMGVGKLRGDENWQDKIRNEGYGLLPIQKDFSRYNVKFLMVEIALRREPTTGVVYTQDADIIKAYWETWLTSMGITDSRFIEQLDPGILHKEIEAFISPQ